MSRRPEGSKCQVRVTLKFLQVSKRATMRKSLASEATKKARKRLRPSIYSLCGAAVFRDYNNGLGLRGHNTTFRAGLWALRPTHGTIFLCTIWTSTTVYYSRTLRFVRRLGRPLIWLGDKDNYLGMVRVISGKSGKIPLKLNQASPYTYNYWWFSFTFLAFYTCWNPDLE